MRDADPGGPLAGDLDASDRAVIADARRGTVAALDDLRATLTTAGRRRADRLKADGTPVTTADRRVDARLSRLVADRFPAHGLISEEGDTVAAGARWTWVVDPIDGTANLSAGLPYWGVSAALCRDGRPVWAVVDAPALERRWQAERGRGAWLDGTRLAVGEPVRLDAAASRHVPLLVTAGIIRRARRRLNPRVLGAIALDLCQVAGGGVAAALHPRPRVWDVAAGRLIVAEAGGVLWTAPGHEPLLPLRAGVDYATASAPVAAGPEAGWLRDLVAALQLGW